MRGWKFWGLARVQSKQTHIAIKVGVESFDTIILKL